MDAEHLLEQQRALRGREVGDVVEAVVAVEVGAAVDDLSFFLARVLAPGQLVDGRPVARIDAAVLDRIAHEVAA